jgi:hypothetical protein
MNELIEEYKLCVQRVQTLDRNIWQSATIFGIGSAAGIIIIFKAFAGLNQYPSLVLMLSFVAITLNLVWWRWVRRWWSIQQALIKRMEFIEPQISFGGNLFIAYLDKINCRRKSEIDMDFSGLSDEIKKELSDMNNYECHGIQPVLFFLTIINIIAWLSLAIILDFEFILHIDKGLILTFIVGLVLFFWFFFEIWDRP